MQITIAEAASRLGITATRVRQLIDLGKLPAVKFGRDWQVDESSVAKRQRIAAKGRLPKGGRPAKE